MQRYRKRLFRTSIATAIITVVCTVLVTVRQDPHDLLRVASPVAATSGWAVQDAAMPGFLWYYWLPDHSILFFRRGEHGGYRAYRQQISLEGRASFSTPLPVPEIASNLRVQSLSPDGKWLYVTRWIRAGEIVPMAIAVDGTKIVTWRHLSSIDLHWTPNGSALLRLQRGRYGMDIDEFRLDGTERQRGAVINYGSGSTVSLLGVVDNGRAIGTVGSGIYFAPQRGLQLENFGVDPPRSAIQSPIVKPIKVNGPAGTTFGGVKLSPDGHSLLWSCTSDLTSPFVVWLSRWRHATYKIDFAHSWWVSHVDGTGMHEIGHIAQRDDNGGVRLDWLPDSRHCSFVYRGKLYVVRTD